MPFVEYLFKKKLQEAGVSGIEFESADIAVWGVTSNGEQTPENSGPEKVGDLLKQADFIIVMEGRQRNFLTRFIDYRYWHKIHQFLDYCTVKQEHSTGSVCGDLEYQTQDEEMCEGCLKLIDLVKDFLKKHLAEKKNLPMVLSV
ncbi:MAG: hypothetical protein LUC45_06935 [Paraprevotella sp.]|nr:hypothetical protein [Paraprevotella sp.]